jgi:ribulose-5-phosphate 4-epimerase/fuculose-1-phosphate aldolase
VQDAIKHVTFTNLATPQPLHAAVDYVTEMLNPADSQSKSRIYVVCGRARRLATDNTGPELQAFVQEHGATAAASEVRKTIGDMATAFVAARTQVGLLVLQAPVAQD